MDKFEYKLMDFKVFKDFKILHNKQLIIWGAAQKGRQIQRTLKRVGIPTTAFCDSDASKWGTSYNGLPTISPYKLKELHKNTPHICIVSCVFRENELLKTLQELELNQILFLSYWGIKTACILYDIDLEPEGTLSVYDDLWKYQKRCSLKSSGDLINFLKNTKINNPSQIWNLQPGKVASKTIETRLKQAAIPSVHLHELTYPSHLWADTLKGTFNLRIQTCLSHGVKIITGVREPLSRDYSAFWQSFTGERSYLSPILNKDFQTMYDCYLELLLKDYDYKKNYLGESCSDIWRDEFEWFDEEIKKHIGVDIYRYPFNREKGYQVIRQGQIEIFIYKAEKLNHIMPMLSEFLETDIFSHENSNLTETKAYYLAYKEFQKNLKLPRSYVEHYYKNNSYMEHFYTKEEQKTLLSKWKDHIMD